MASYTGRDKYEDYTYDDDINNEYDEDFEGEDMSLTDTISDWVKKTKSAIFKKNNSYYDDEDYEEDEEEDEPEYTDKKKSSFKERFAKRNNSYDEDDEEDVSSYEKASPKKKTSEYTREDYDSYDKKYGTNGSYIRAEQTERNHSKLGIKKDKKRTASSNITKLYKEEGDKGNVNGVLKFSPKSINDTNDIADNLMNHYAALIDLRGMNKAEILRILDFVDGVAYVLDYSFDELSKEMYMCAPKGFLRNFGDSRYKNMSND